VSEVIRVVASDWNRDHILEVCCVWCGRVYETKCGKKRVARLTSCNACQKSHQPKNRELSRDNSGDAAL
jgi:hypothetical protein